MQDTVSDRDGNSADLLVPAHESPTVVDPCEVGALRVMFRQNPEKGLTILFKRYYGPLCSHAFRFVGCRQVAEDLVGEVFFQFCRTEAYQNVTSSYSSYLFRSVRNECYEHLRSEAVWSRSFEAADELSAIVSHQRPDAEFHYLALLQKVDQVIDQLPRQCRKAFKLSRFENKKYHQIARELSISPKTVEIHISKALRHLREALHEERAK